MNIEKEKVPVIDENSKKRDIRMITSEEDSESESMDSEQERECVKSEILDCFKKRNEPMTIH